MRYLLRTLLVCLLLLAAPFITQAQEAIVQFQSPGSNHYRTIVIQLYPEDAPQTVANFIKLAINGFYNGLAIHRILPDALIQTGDPLSRYVERAGVGTNGPGYTLPAEIRRKNVRGAVAMAGLPTSLNPSRRSNGSQFYILLKPNPTLDNEYTVFGQVTAGLEFLDLMSRRPRDTNDYPLERILIRSILIR